jgi:hypothetical protein
MKIVFLLILLLVIFPFVFGNQVKKRQQEFKNHNKKNES